jgi:hypothetical protein
MAFITENRILETSTSTGTGAMVLAGAVAGFRAFSARMTSPSDSCFYMIEAVDSNGVPTGDWETGVGTYSAANTLTRTTVMRSSNSDSVVTFAAGTKRVAIAIDAASLSLTWPSFSVNCNTNQTVANSGFNTLTLDTVSSDSHSGWSTSINTYTVPTGHGGLWFLSAKMRILDGITSNISYGMGIDTSNGDTPAFAWTNTNSHRQGHINTRLAPFAVGDKIRLFTYIDAGSSVTVSACELVGYRVR